MPTITPGTQAFMQELAESLYTGISPGQKHRYAKGRESFYHFLRYAKVGYQWSWHHRLMAEELQRVADYILTGHGTPRLIITCPPRHTKSSTVSECFPPWLLGYALQRTGRHLSVILSSYAHELAVSFGASARDLVKTEMYQSIFPGVTVARGFESAHNWKIAGSTERSSMLSTGVLGPSTGFGAHCLLIDDPLKNAEDASSTTMLEKQWQWYTLVARTRVQPGGAIVITMTRWSYDDIVGRVLETDPDGWKVIHLKALADEDEPPHRKAGDALWPRWFSVEALNEIRRDIGERAFSTLYQGEPVPEGGQRLKTEWLQEAPLAMWDASRRGTRAESPWHLVYGVDPSTGEGNDYTAIAKIRWNPAEGKAIVADVLRGRWSFTELVNVLTAEAEREKPLRIVIEKVAFSAWVTQHLNATTTLPVVASKVPTRSKEARLAGLDALGAQFETGRVLVPPRQFETPGIIAFRQEWATFPAGRNDDTLDAVALGIEGTALAQKAERAGGQFLFPSAGSQRSGPRFPSPFDL